MLVKPVLDISKMVDEVCGRLVTEDDCKLVPGTEVDPETLEVGRIELPVDKTPLADEDGPVEGRVL